MTYKKFMHGLNQLGFTKIKDIMQKNKCNWHGKYFLIYTDGRFELTTKDGSEIDAWDIENVHDYPYENIIATLQLYTQGLQACNKS